MPPVGAALPQAGWRRTILAEAKEMLGNDGEKGPKSLVQRRPHGQPKHTLTPSVEEREAG